MVNGESAKYRRIVTSKALKITTVQQAANISPLTIDHSPIHKFAKSINETISHPL
jgi:hypothetical protein